MATSLTKKRRITFKLTAPEAQKVSLMGEFNNWDPKTHVMKKDRKGVWSTTILIAPGRYEYKFFVDGEWWNDPHNDQTVLNAFGSINNFLTM
jgi:1,4-alpha-glucan branching enzyme